MIKTQIIGFIGKDAEFKSVNDKTVINFTVAHTEKYKNKNGEPVEKTTWVECSLWGRPEKLTDLLKKGSRIYCEGVPSAKGYKDKNGDANAALVLNVSDFEVMF